jgi:arylsulfatase A-like enzyme
MHRIAYYLFWLGSLCYTGVALAAPTRPNILFLFADDWGRYAHVYDELDHTPSINQVLKTPHLDRLAHEGVIFRNAFVTAPSCTPCRSSLLSGQYFFRTGLGAILQGAHWDSRIPTYPLLLRDAGYHLGKSYKVWSPGTPADAPYGGQQYAYEKAGRAYNRFSSSATQLVKEGATWPQAQAKLLGQIRENFRTFLKAKPADQPFCFWFGPTLTHRPYEKNSGQALWGINPDDLKGKLPSFIPDVPEIRADFADYMGEVQAWDAGVGELLQELAAQGQLEQTIIIISGDHGMPGVPAGKCNLYDFGVRVPLIAWGPGIKAGRVVDDLINLMDLAPTFLELGGVTPPAVMNGKSFAPLLWAKHSGQIDPTRTWVVTGRERHVAFARPGNLPYPQRALRTQEFLYVRNFAPDRWPLGQPNFTSRQDFPGREKIERNTYTAFADMDASPSKAWLVDQFDNPQWQWQYNLAFALRPGEELFDLKRDPEQTKNVAQDPAYQKIREALAQQLLQTLREAGDPRVLGDGLTFERPPFVGTAKNDEK